MLSWQVAGETDLPLTSDDRDWDGDDTKDAIFRWAGWPDDNYPEKAKKGFFAFDDGEADQKQSYKLPFATIVDDELKAVPRAIQAVAVVLEGGRGGVDLPDNVISDVRTRVEGYYRKMGEEVPW